MCQNYFDELEKLPAALRRRIQPLNGNTIESLEIFLLGGIPNPSNNGRDGYGPNFEPLEIKTHGYNYYNEQKAEDGGKATPLSGRGKYPFVFEDTFDKKVKRNDLCIHIGYFPNGDVAYKFSFKYAAITDHLRESWENDWGALSNLSKNAINIDYSKVNNHDTFTMHYIDPDILNIPHYEIVKGQTVFTKSFFKALTEYNRDLIEDWIPFFSRRPTYGQPNTLARREKKQFDKFFN